MTDDDALNAELNRMFAEGEIAATGARSIWEPQYELTAKGRERHQRLDDEWNAESRRLANGRNLRKTVGSLAQWVAAYRGKLPRE